MLKQTAHKLRGWVHNMVFPPTYLPGGLLSGVPATEATEVVRLSQITNTLVPQLFTTYLSTGPAACSSTTLTTLGTVTIPANTFSSSLNGIAFRLRMGGGYAANANNKQVTVILNTVTIFDTGTVATNNKKFSLDMIFLVTGFGDPNYSLSSVYTVDGSSSVVSNSIQPSISVLPTAAITFTFKGQGGATNDIIAGPMLITSSPYTAF